MGLIGLVGLIGRPISPTSSISPIHEEMMTFLYRINEDLEAAIKVLQSLVKQRRDSIEQSQQAGRIELAEKEAAEIKVIEEYLPAALDEAAIARVVEETIAETGASSMKEMGAVMKAVMAKLAGQTVDGKAVNQIVKSKLGG